MRSETRCAALDETAVFGNICRHHFPQYEAWRKVVWCGCLNESLGTISFHMSRFAYPVYLLEKLKETMHGDQQLMLFYGIACSFEAHLKVCIQFSVYMYVLSSAYVTIYRKTRHNVAPIKNFFFLTELSASRY